MSKERLTVLSHYYQVIRFDKEEIDLREPLNRRVILVVKPSQGGVTHVNYTDLLKEKVAC